MGTLTDNNHNGPTKYLFGQGRLSTQRRPLAGSGGARRFGAVPGPEPTAGPSAARAALRSAPLRAAPRRSAPLRCAAPRRAGGGGGWRPLRPSNSPGRRRARLAQKAEAPARTKKCTGSTLPMFTRDVVLLAHSSLSQHSYR